VPMLFGVMTWNRAEMTTTASSDPMWSDVPADPGYDHRFPEVTHLHRTNRSARAPIPSRVASVAK
jgi:hypothetical protein